MISDESRNNALGKVVIEPKLNTFCWLIEMKNPTSLRVLLRGLGFAPLLIMLVAVRGHGQEKIPDVDELLTTSEYQFQLTNTKEERQAARDLVMADYEQYPLKHAAKAEKLYRAAAKLLQPIVENEPYISMTMSSTVDDLRRLEHQHDIDAAYLDAWKGVISCCGNDIDRLKRLEFPMVYGWGKLRERRDWAVKVAVSHQHHQDSKQ